MPAPADRPQLPGHCLLHCHFESALRALAVARPGRLDRLRAVYGSPAYARATPAQRLGLLDEQVTALARGQDVFTRAVFAEVVRRLCEEMTMSGISHVDLRIGVMMGRWPWIGSLADAIGAFHAQLPGEGTLAISFLAAVNLSKPPEVLDVALARITEDARTGGLLAGLDINLLPADLPVLDRYLPVLRDLQRGGLLVAIHLGELFGAGFSRRVLSRITPAGSATASCCSTTRGPSG